MADQDPLLYDPNIDPVTAIVTVGQSRVGHVVRGNHIRSTVRNALEQNPPSADSPLVAWPNTSTLPIDPSFDRIGAHFNQIRMPHQHVPSADLSYPPTHPEIFPNVNLDEDDPEFPEKDFVIKPSVKKRKSRPASKQPTKEYPDLFSAQKPDLYAAWAGDCSRGRVMSDFLKNMLAKHWAAGHFHDEFGSHRRAVKMYFKVLDARPRRETTAEAWYKAKRKALWGTPLSVAIARCPNHGRHELCTVQSRTILYKPLVRPKPAEQATPSHRSRQQQTPVTTVDNEPGLHKAQQALPLPITRPAAHTRSNDDAISAHGPENAKFSRAGRALQGRLDIGHLYDGNEQQRGQDESLYDKISAHNPKDFGSSSIDSPKLTPEEFRRLNERPFFHPEGHFPSPELSRPETVTDHTGDHGSVEFSLPDLFDRLSDSDEGELSSGD